MLGKRGFQGIVINSRGQGASVPLYTPRSVGILEPFLFFGFYFLDCLKVVEWALTDRYIILVFDYNQDDARYQLATNID